MNDDFTHNLRSKSIILPLSPFDQRRNCVFVAFEWSHSSFHLFLITSNFVLQQHQSRAGIALILTVFGNGCNSTPNNHSQSEHTECSSTTAIHCLLVNSSQKTHSQQCLFAQTGSCFVVEIVTLVSSLPVVCTSCVKCHVLHCAMCLTFSFEMHHMTFQ